MPPGCDLFGHRHRLWPDRRCPECPAPVHVVTADPVRFDTSWPVPPSLVELSVRSPRPGIDVLEVRGEIDLLEAGEIATRANELLRGSAQVVVLDLSGVRFMGSHGLTTVVRTQRSAVELGRELRGVTGRGNRAVIRPVSMTGLDRLITWFADADEACA